MWRGLGAVNGWRLPVDDALTRASKLHQRRRHLEAELLGLAGGMGGGEGTPGMKWNTHSAVLIYTTETRQLIRVSYCVHASVRLECMV